MSFERIADRKIREAMAEGTFDVVADGRPLNLEDYFRTPEDLRLAHSILKSANCVPEEVADLKEVERLRQLLAATPDEASRQPIRVALAAVTLRLDLALERARRK